MPHYLYIETVGCQMNVLDSEMVVASLRPHGYELVPTPEAADTILFNTCSVRQHAEDKIYSALGKLRQQKRQDPRKVIGVLGCMAQKDQRLIFERAPYVDLVIGPGQLPRPRNCWNGPATAAAASWPSAWAAATAVWNRSDAATRRSIRSATRRCGRPRPRPTCGSRSAATSSAPTAWCP